MDAEKARKIQERENLRNVVAQWNANRLDLFALSEPNENLEFHGVMRFYFQDAGQKVATKCIRVSSTATSRLVIDTLVEKFRPDMRMLDLTDYGLYEIHENGDERPLADEEKPLLVQLNWHRDDREGRFLLRRPNDITRPTPEPSEDGHFKRKLSKREKKELKKQEKLQRIKSVDANENDTTVAGKLYNELPETSFTRSISNPEAVMRRRRQQKLEKKLQQFRSRDGGPDTGGTLKIYGQELCKDVPYKTLLLSVRENAAYVVREMLEKYGLSRDEFPNFCLVQVVGETAGEYSASPNNREYILDDDECPLAILMNHPSTRGAITFHIRRKPADFQPRKRKKKPKQGEHSRYDENFENLPFLLEITPDGTPGAMHSIHVNMTEVGSEGTGLKLVGPDIYPRHCVIAYTDDIVTVTPSSREAETYVNDTRIYETSLLSDGVFVKFGRSHTFRFIDPLAEERNRLRHSSSRQETERIIPREAILPASLELVEETEDSFLHATIMDVDGNLLQFKLAPTYAVYMMARYRASTHFRPELTPMQRAIKLTQILTKVALMVQQAIQKNSDVPSWLAFWMANSSEMLHFLKQDRHVSAYSLDAQDILAENVQTAFRKLVNNLTDQLLVYLPGLIQEGSVDENVMGVLSDTMALLRKCRVNAALTIQLFSHVFHFINCWLFHKVVVERGSIEYCTRHWGTVLRHRIQQLEMWAEKQGLELAAECHLSRIMQTTHFLQAQKHTSEDWAAISSACFKLNSLQLRALMERYQPERGEMSMSPEEIKNIVRVAENTADELLMADGREVKVAEDPEAGVPFLLPEDGYSADIVRGVPPGLSDFLQPLEQAGLCRLNPHPNANSGTWTIYMKDANPIVTHTSNRSSSAMSGLSGQMSNDGSRPIGEPPIITMQLQKSNSGMGLSIVAAKGASPGQSQSGIFIKSVVKGGAADLDGRLQAGDQLLSVDGQSLIGITQEKAAEYMTRTGPIVTLDVAKQGAIYCGLATLLSQPSPIPAPKASSEVLIRSGSRSTLPPRVVNDWDPRLSRTLPPGLSGPGPRRLSERDLPSSVNTAGPRMATSKSVPSLNSDAPPVLPNKHHEVYNPGYRASSQSSIAHPGPPTQVPLRSRSSQNLGGNTDDDRHYQNINMYNPHPSVASRLPPRPHPAEQRHPGTRSLHSSHTALHRPDSALQRDRPASAFVSLKEQHQMLMQSQDPSMRAAQRGHDKMEEMGEELRRREEALNRGGFHRQMAADGASIVPRPMQSPGHHPPPRPPHADQPPARPPPPEEYMKGHPGSPHKLFSTTNPWDREEKEKEKKRRTATARMWRDEQISMLESTPNRTPKQEETLRTLILEREFQRRAEEAMNNTDTDGDEEENDDIDRRELLRMMQEDMERSRLRREQEKIEQKAAEEELHQKRLVQEKLHQERLAQERAHHERIAHERAQQEKAYQERLAQERAHQDRLAQERAHQERLAQERAYQERLAQERAHQERVAQERAKQDRLIERANQERIQHHERMAQERAYQERLNQELAYAQRQLQEQSLQEITQERFERELVISERNQRGPHHNSPQPFRLSKDKLEEVRKKEQQLALTNQAEQRILLEAQRRQEEDLRNRTVLQDSYHNGGDAPPLPTSPPPPVSQRLDNLINSPPQPPQRDSSFTVTNMIRNNTPTDHNPEVFLTEAETLLSPQSTTGPSISPGNTPGVIGAQEVYRDPRTRRLAEQKANASKGGTTAQPEKLSFKEKMKMFAIETGEEHTPKDKIKTSRAQREIESVEK